jgi:hypothetical protein
MIKVESCGGCPLNVLKGWFGNNNYLACKAILMDDFLNNNIKGKCEITDSTKTLPNCPLDDYKDTAPLEEKLTKIKSWCESFPLKVFPEPDLKKAHEILEKNGMTLDSISASAMRHVLEEIKKIINRD